MMWVRFYPDRANRQKLPFERRYVLVQLAEQPAKGLPPSVAVGYLKYSAGDKTCPYFVIPGIGGTVEFWSDCLGDDFFCPLWEGKQKPIGVLKRR